jgi:hypothetical protein
MTQNPDLALFDGWHWITYDSVYFKVVDVDLDIDSDNANGLERSAYEDKIEDKTGTGYPGKIIAVNDNDDDGDGIPDFADGFNKFGGTSNQTWNEQFTPLALELLGPIDYLEARLRITYNDSDPDGVTRTGAGTPADPYVYTPATGHLRIWTKDGWATRTSRSIATRDMQNPDDNYLGFYVPSGVYDELEKFDFNAQTRVLTLYVEGIDVSAALADQRIKVEIDPDGAAGPLDYIALDAVRSTVIKADLDAHTIYRNASAGLLPDSLEAVLGAWLPKNDDDDDYDASNTPDYQQSGEIVGENDLLPIVLHPLQPTGLGGTYWLVFNNQLVRVWQNANRTGEVVSTPSPFQTVFDASVETTLYVEGIAGSGSTTIRVDWVNGTEYYSMMDVIVINLFSWVGPLNVPDYSIHRYTATGGMSGAGNSQWVAPPPLEGTLNSSTPGDQVDECSILWGSGPVVGMAMYQAQANYVWGLDVNVVEIKIEPPDAGDAFTAGTPTDGGNPGNRKFVSSGSPGLSWAAKVTLNGPNGDRGVKFMRIGFVQNVTFSTNTGTYNTQSVTLTSNLQGQSFLDCVPTSTAPYYSVTDSGSIRAVFFDPSPTNKVKTINSNDTPCDGPPLMYQGDILDSMCLVWNFRLYITARTIDTRNNAHLVYTSRSRAYWQFNGSGTIDQTAPYAWTAGAGAGVTAPSGWTSVTDGSQPPILDGETANQALARETFN